jgi:hypothetical protein
MKKAMDSSDNSKKTTEWSDCGIQVYLKVQTSVQKISGLQ